MYNISQGWSECNYRNIPRPISRICVTAYVISIPICYWENIGMGPDQCPCDIYHLATAVYIIFACLTYLWVKTNKHVLLVSLCMILAYSSPVACIWAATAWSIAWVVLEGVAFTFSRYTKVIIVMPCTQWVDMVNTVLTGIWTHLICPLSLLHYSLTHKGC